MKLDLVIDVVCPWCYVGKKQFDKALELRPDLMPDVWIRPYQLSTTTPEEGVDRRSYYDQKFPDKTRLAVMRQHLHDQAKALGISFDFDSDCRIANTLDAHRLILWAKGIGAQSFVADELMKRYFEECAFLGDHELLLDVAVAAGMDKPLVADLLASDKDRDHIAEQVSQARQMGIQGVPTYIFNQRSALSGAQGIDAILKALDSAVS